MKFFFSVLWTIMNKQLGFKSLSKYNILGAISKLRYPKSIQRKCTNGNVNQIETRIE